jgi:type IV secretory pathway VirB10-like protein
MERSNTRAGRAAAPCLAAVWLLAAAACAPFQTTTREPQQPPAEVAVTAPPATAPGTPPPRPPRKPAPPQATAPAVAVPAAVPAVPPPPTPAPPGAFDRLNGLDPVSTVALLGEPRQRAEAPPATIWRYSTRDCELDVYFYLDLRTNQLHALHYELRSQDHDAAERPQQRCYEQLVSERGASAEPTVGADHPR